jgi:hypothetical protein
VHREAEGVAGLVPAGGGFDLDDVRTEVAEQHAAERSGQHLAEVEHAQAVQRRRLS